MYDVCVCSIITVLVCPLLASRELQRRLEAVRFPGFSGEEEEEEGGSDRELAAIEVFSESGSDVNGVDG